MKKVSLFMIALFAFAAFLPLKTLACACCAEGGEYSISTVKPDLSKISMLAEMKFDGAAELFTTPAGFDDIKGLNSIKASYEASDSPDFFTLENVFAAKTWKLNFKTANGKTGTLNLPMPMQMLSFKADIHDTAEGSEVSLYKEWRFKGTVQSGNGFFTAGITKPTTYFLVLQGRGNNCDNAADFKYWRLEITGKNANYAFFGKLN